jgi:hypothetical protein
VPGGRVGHAGLGGSGRGNGGWGCEGLIVKAAAPELGDEMAGMQGGEGMAGHGRVCRGVELMRQADLVY